MGLAEQELIADDGTNLFVRWFRPDSGDASRTLLIVHGVCEHGARYEHVARMLVDEGWNVVIPDLRGHGRSGGVPVHVTSFRRYASDLKTVYKHFELDSNQTALLGHSMGGLISLRFAQIHPGDVSALVLISPLLGIEVPIPRTTIAAGRVLSVVAPRTRFRSRVDPQWTTRSEETLKRRADDELMHRSVTAGWYFAMKASLAAAWEETDRVRLPLLIMQAGNDKIVDAAAPEAWLEQVSESDTTFRRFEEHYHELLNEPDWTQTVESVIGWLAERISTQPMASQQNIA
jgi:lysophospholipase